MIRKISSALPILFAALALPALAQVYTWKDENGRTIVSDKPQPGKQPKAARPVRPAADPDSDAAAAKSPDKSKSSAGAQVGSDPEIEKRRLELEAREKAEAEQKASAIKAKKAEYCQGNRAALANLESGERVWQMSPAGERIFLDDAQRAAEIARVKQLLADCPN